MRDSLREKRLHELAWEALYTAPHRATETSIRASHVQTLTLSPQPRRGVEVETVRRELDELGRPPPVKGEEERIAAEALGRQSYWIR